MISLLYPYNSLRVTDCRCCFTELSYRTNSRCCCAVFYSQLTSKVIHARSVQSVVYLERHVVSFGYFVSSIVRNNRLYITPPRFQRFVRTKGILGKAWCYSLKMSIMLHVIVVAKSDLYITEKGRYHGHRTVVL